LKCLPAEKISLRNIGTLVALSCHKNPQLGYHLTQQGLLLHPATLVVYCHIQLKTRSLNFPLRFINESKTHSSFFLRSRFHYPNLQIFKIKKILHAIKKNDVQGNRGTHK
jgi:hypothetical protein